MAVSASVAGTPSTDVGPLGRGSRRRYRSGPRAGVCTAMPERGVRGRDYAGDPVKGFSQGIVIEDGQQKLPTPGHSLTLCGPILCGR